MTLVDPYHIPPGGWHYVQTETGLEIRGGDFFDLCQKVRKHRQMNKLATSDLVAQVETQICERLNAEARSIYCRDSGPPKELKRVAFADVKHFLLTLSHLKHFVPQKEAERRASICSTCPLNYPIAGCTSCRNLPGLIFRTIGRRTTSQDLHLKGCGVCGCSLAASVHVPLTAFPTEPKYQYPQWCWHNA